MLFIKIHLVLKCEFENSPLIIGHQYIIIEQLSLSLCNNIQILNNHKRSKRSQFQKRNKNKLKFKQFTTHYNISNIKENYKQSSEIFIVWDFFFFFFKEVQAFSYPFNEHASNKDAYLTDHIGNSTPITGFPSPYYFGFSKTAKSVLHTQHTDAHIHVQNALYIPKLFMVLITVYLLKIKTILNHKHKNWVVRFSISHMSVCIKQD